MDDRFDIREQSLEDQLKDEALREKYGHLLDRDKDQEYIRYGSPHFDYGKFKQVRNPDKGSKPREGGLWASRRDDTYGWRDWCKQESFRRCEPEFSFTFKFKEDAKVLTISSVDDIKQLPLRGDKSYHGESIDYEELIREGIDAFEVRISEDGGLYDSLYTYDMNSVVVLNSDCIVPKDNDKWAEQLVDKMERANVRDGLIERPVDGKTVDEVKAVYDLYGKAAINKDSLVKGNFFPMENAMALSMYLYRESGGELVISADGLSDMVSIGHYSLEESRDMVIGVLRGHYEQKGEEYVVDKDKTKNIISTVLSYPDYSSLRDDVLRCYREEGHAREVEFVTADSLYFSRESALMEELKKDTVDERTRAEVNYWGTRQFIYDLCSGEEKGREPMALLTGLLKDEVMKDTTYYRFPIDERFLLKAYDAVNKYEPREGTDSSGRERTPENGFYKFSNSDKVFVYRTLEGNHYLRMYAEKLGATDKLLRIEKGLNGLNNREERFPRTTEMFDRLKTERYGEK